MKVCIYAIYDPKLERYNTPFFARNDQEACVLLLRSGIPKSIYQDIKLFNLGVFSDDARDVKEVLYSYVDPDEIKLLPYLEVTGNG